VAGAGVRDVVVRPIFADEVGRFNAALTGYRWLGHRLTGQVWRYVAVLGGEWGRGDRVRVRGIVVSGPRSTVVPRSFWLLVERPAGAERLMIFGVSR
jgi:hypothetical protein